MAIFAISLENGKVVCFYSTDTLEVVFANAGYTRAADLFSPSKNVGNIERPIRTLYMTLTYRCNLSCSYCVCHNSFSNGPKDMSMETAICAVDVFSKISLKNTDREVVLYGGEPTLRKDLIKTVYSYCKDASDSYGLQEARFILCTNGTLIDQKFCDFLRGTNIYPAVSIDGTKEIHDEHRKFARGENSYDKSVGGYELLVDSGIEAGITMTLGSYNIARLPEVVDRVYSQFRPKTIAINPLVDYKTSKNPYCASPRELETVLWDVFMTCRKNGAYVVKHIMDNRVKPFVEMKPREYGCTGTGGRMCVTPEGHVLSCMALSGNTKIVSLKDVKTKMDFVDEYMMEHSPLSKRQCSGCIAKATCGGMCPANLKLNRTSVDDSFCASSIYFTNKLLELLWTENKMEAVEEIKNKNVFIPTKAHRRKIYSNIKTQEISKDFQYSPNW